MERKKASAAILLACILALGKLLILHNNVGRVYLLTVPVGVGACLDSAGHNYL